MNFGMHVVEKGVYILYIGPE